jgi:hypothetical protein
VASLTRARIRTSELWAFARSIPPVVADLERAEGLQLRLGIGDAPVGLQGTFSVWRSASDVTAFAYRGAAHAEVIRTTQRRGWYAEELFARFAVLSTEGTYRGSP